MTQPTSVDMTFDTSLVDVNPPPPPPPPPVGNTDNTTANTNVTAPYPSPTTGDAMPPPSTSLPTNNGNANANGNGTAKQKQKATIQHLTTQTTYDAWAEVYDSDGNMLQAIDDAEMEELLPRFLGLVQSSVLDEQGKELRVLDLGCGTGRNTAKLVGYAWEKGGGEADRKPKVEVVGVDFSRGMIEVARRKLAAFLSPSTTTASDEEDASKTGRKGVGLRLEHCDCFPPPSPSNTPFPSHPEFHITSLPPSNAIISTLVLEHIPLPLFFTTLSSLLLPPRGLALITNMHADMGSRSQAGFVNSEGIKIRGTSFVYTVDEMLEQAGKAGFEVLEVKEREVRGSDLETGVVGARGAKWVGVRVWVGVVVRRV